MQMRSTIVEIERNDSNPRGTWAPVLGDFISFRCVCGVSRLIAKKEVEEDGTIRNAIDCECGFEETLKLVNWPPLNGHKKI